MAKSSKPRSQGAGRKANSEPRQQVFKEFAGCNFELSPRDFSLGMTDAEQADLQMNYVVIQNNAGIASNKTIETRSNLVKIADAPLGGKFTGVDLVHDGTILLGLEDQNIWTIGLDKMVPPGETEPVYPTRFVSLFGPGHSAPSGDHHWSSFCWAAGELVGLTEENRLWHGSTAELHYEEKIDDPVALPNHGNLSPVGTLDISDTYDATTHPHRVDVKFAYVGAVGSTACCPAITVYANTPVKEWNSNCYLKVGGFIPRGDETLVKAVEVFYSLDNSSSFLPAGRTEQINMHPASDVTYGANWKVSWYGYLDATADWDTMNMIAPTENTTEGVKASHMSYIDSRAYFWGNRSKPERLYIGGLPGNAFNTSAGVGGGWCDVDPGSGKEIRIVTKYKTQSGASIVTILCDSPNSTLEQRYNLVKNDVQLSQEQSMKSWQAEHVAGSVGCKSFKGGLVCEDGLYTVSRYGLALTTLTMEYNSQIRTNYVSDPIKPCFTDKLRWLLRRAVLIESDGVIYIAFGKDDEQLDNVIFCYDIDQKAWWSCTIDVDDEKIVDMIHIDYQNHREGIGIVTQESLYLLPLTQEDSPEDDADFPFLIQTGELSTAMPQQGWEYLSQIEFRFDYFKGSATIELDGIDQFGRKITVSKSISHDETMYDLAEWMRVDLRLQSYRLRISGTARFRLTHWISKLYVMSAKQGLVWGFDDRESHRTSGDIHPTFKDYNDIRNAIIP